MDAGPINRIVVEQISKRYRRYHSDRPRTLQEAILRGVHRLRSEEMFWALDKVSFHVGAGTMVGVIGANGAGKSTLLRLIGGVGRPDHGRVITRGRIGTLLELGAGFHPDLTGRENLYINGVISGLTRWEIRQQFEAIIHFAELEAFIDSPLRTYSTGMQMRLAFSIAAHTNPEILLIDEVIAVGDVAFQRKCIERIGQFKANGCAILLVSHDAEGVKRLCDQALWLRSGKLVAHGSAETVVSLYLDEMRSETRSRTPETHPVLRTKSGAELSINQNRFGSLEMEIRDVQLKGQGELPVGELQSGDPMEIEIDILSPQLIPTAHIGVTIRKESGEICLDISGETQALGMAGLYGRGKISLHLDRLDLTAGGYYVDVGAYRQDWSYAYDYHWGVYSFTVGPASAQKGVMRPPHRWTFEENQPVQDRPG